MAITKEVIRQCLISKREEIDKAFEITFISFRDNLYKLSRKALERMSHRIW